MYLLVGNLLMLVAPTKYSCANTVTRELHHHMSLIGKRKAIASSLPDTEPLLNIPTHSKAILGDGNGFYFNRLEHYVK